MKMQFINKTFEYVFKLLLNNDHPRKQQFPKSTHSSFPCSVLHHCQNRSRENEDLKIKIAHPQRTGGGMTGGRLDWVFENL